MKLSKKTIIMGFAALAILFCAAIRVQAVEKEEKFFGFIKGDDKQCKKEKIAYLTFDDGPSIYTEELLDVLNEYGISGIFFVLGAQFDYIPNADEILNRMVDEGHHIALHTMTHDKNTLYWSQNASANFVAEMLELRDEVATRTGQVTNLCRAPYGKKGHFNATHYRAVEDAGLHCIDWHVDSKDWAKKNADEIYSEVVCELKRFEDADEIVLLFHEYERTVEALPRVIEHLLDLGYTFKPYAPGKVFEGI
ncbi:MAG: polysaccharide deacetylase family protein [Turicibacter sp.]|nr:polysaccharide deacetylase family protein [Turicibacter sp.]